jgi:hypothetical protein
LIDVAIGRQLVTNGPRPDWPRLKAQALVITVDYGRADGIDISLKGGPIDRIYGNGTNPDPFGLGGPPP